MPMFHHAVEAYKIADLLAKNDICVGDLGRLGRLQDGGLSTPSSANSALTNRAGACVMIHSDDPYGIQRLNQEVAKAMASRGSRPASRRPRTQAVKWMTINPAWALGLDDKIGSLEAGKNADVVLWYGRPIQCLRARREGLDRRRDAL